MIRKFAVLLRNSQKFARIVVRVRCSAIMPMSERWHFVDTVTQPDGIRTTIGYDSVGNRIWRQLGDDASRRIQFKYAAFNELNGLNVAELRAEGALPPKGTANIRGFRYLRSVSKGVTGLGALLMFRDVFEAEKSARLNHTDALFELLRMYGGVSNGMRAGGFVWRPPDA